MSSIEDRLRGYKKENLVGSSDSEGESGDGNKSSGAEASSDGAPSNIPPPVMDGMPKTGPKGVLADYYMQMMEDHQRTLLKEQQRKQMIEAHSATVQTHAAEKAQTDEATAEATARMNVAKALEDGPLDHDQFMKSYRASRMAELKKQASLGNERKRFGSLMEIRGDSYATVIDNCPPTITLIIHIYNELYDDCVNMNRCLTKLAKFYPTAKLCRVQSASLGLSQTFTESGLPTLMVYRNGDVIGNFPMIVADIGRVYEVADLEHFLREKGCLPPEAEKEDSYFFGNSSGAMKLLGMSRPSQQSDSDDD